MKSQVEIDELMARIHEEAHRRGGGPLPRRLPTAQGTTANGAPAEPTVPVPPAFEPSASGGALPGGLLVQAGQMIEHARRKVAVAPGVPGWLRPFYRNQGGYNSILLEALECMREANRQLIIENDALRRHVEKQNRWMEGATRGITTLENRLASLERQNEHDQHWFANLQAHAEGQTAWADATNARLHDLHAQIGQLDQDDAGRTVQGDESNARMDDLHSQLDQFQAQSDTQSAHTREVHGHLDELGKHTDGLQGQIGELAQRLDEIVRRADETQAHVGRVNHQTDEVQSHTDRLAVHLHNLQAQADEQGSHTRQVHGHLDELGQHVNRVNDNVGGLSTRLDELGQHVNRVNDNVGGLSTRLDELGQHVNRVNDNVGGLSTRLDELGQHVNRVNDNVGGLSTHLADLQTQADAQGAHTRQVHGYLDDMGRQANHWGGLVDRFGQQTDEVRDQLAGLVERFGQQTDEVRARLSGLGTHLNDLQAQANEQGEYGRRVHGHLDDLGKHLDEELKGEQPTSIASRQKRQEEAIRRLDDRLVTDASFIKNQLWIHQRMLLASGRAAGNPETPLLPGDHGEGGEPSADAVSVGDLDSLYVAFEDVFRGSREDIKQRLEIYLPYLSNARVGASDRPLLDLGCGRGEWLELLGERHIAASGIDLNHRMIEQCRQRGLPATHANAVHHLASLPDASVGAITAFHLIEHLPFAVLVRFFRECRRVLQPGGVAIYETPNPYNIIVGAAQFYDDHTHQRPLPPNSTRFLVEQAGFARAEVLPLHPREDADKVHGDGTNEALVVRFNELFYGPQDYAIVATVTA